MIKTFPWLRTRTYPGFLLLLIAASVTAPAADVAAPPAAIRKSLHPTITRYPAAVQPVVENLGAMVRRAQRRSILQLPVIASQHLVNGKTIFPSTPEMLGRFASPALKLDSETASSKPESPLILMASSPPPDVQFDTIGFINIDRPDSAVTAGPSHLVTAVNFAFQVQDLNGGGAVATNLNAFFGSDTISPSGDPTNSVGDPRLSYDQATGRFIMSALGFDYPQTGEQPTDGDSWCDMAISATSDPYGDWYKYSFQVLRNGTEQMDFDSLGYDGTAIYVTARMRDFANNTNFSGNRMLIFDKAKALAGQPLTPIIVDDLMLPGGGLAEIVKPIEPGEPVTAASPSYFMCTSGNSAVALYTLTDPLGSPSFSGVDIPIPAWVNAGLAPQAGSSSTLVQGAGFPLHKTIMLGGVIWSCQSPSATGIPGDRAGVRVYRVDPVAATLLGSYSISDSSLWFYLPAVVPDISGNAVVGFHGSDANNFVSMYHARYVASMDDFEAPAVTAAGLSGYEYTAAKGGTTENWGDYSDAALDFASGGRAVWVHGVLPVTTTTWKMHAARIPSTDRPIIGVNTDHLQYGTLCPGETKDKTLTVSNSGTADLHVSDIDRISGSSQFALVAGPAFPTTIPPGGHADYTIRFGAALPTGSKSATFRIFSDDPVTPTVDVAASGTVDAPEIAASPSTIDYGEVCAEDGPGHLKTLHICNNSVHCPLSVTDISISNAEFEVVGSTSFVVPPGDCHDVTVKFTPTSIGEKTADLTVTSDDPGGPVIIALKGKTPPPSIVAPAYRAFPPTVLAPCFTEVPLPVQNNGICNVTINAVTITGADAGEFTLVNLPPGGFPVTLAPGQNLGSGLAVQFRPTSVRRVHQAKVEVIYVTDPITSATSTVLVPLYGEGVNTGARLLVTLGGVPVANVEKIHLQLADPSRNGGNEVTHDIPLTSVVGPVPELTFKYHREWGGASNPAGLPPDDYKATVTIKVGKKQQTKTVYFTVLPCGFNANVVASF